MSAKTGVLSLCASCRHAEWDKTANGRRHPNGDGQCRYVPLDAPLPKCRTFLWGRHNDSVNTVHKLLEVRAGNADIYWRESYRLEPEPCACWEAK